MPHTAGQSPPHLRSEYRPEKTCAPQAWTKFFVQDWRGSLFLLEGQPGTGKTTIPLQMLSEGQKAGVRSLYITLSKTKQELLNTAASHGWTIGAAIEIFGRRACSMRMSSKPCFTPQTLN